MDKTNFAVVPKKVLCQDHRRVDSHVRKIVFSIHSHELAFCIASLGGRSVTCYLMSRGAFYGFLGIIVKLKLGFGRRLVHGLDQL